MIELTFKQEKFAQGVVKGLSQADAYRSAYEAGKMKPDSIHQLASKLMANVKVTSRIEELRRPVAERVDMSVHAHVSRLARLRDAAESAGDHGPAVRAEMAIGQVAGHYVQKLEVNNNFFAKYSADQKIELLGLVEDELSRRERLEQLPATDVQDVTAKGE